MYGVNMGSAVCMFQKFMNSVGIRESGPLSSFGQGFVAFIQPAVPFMCLSNPDIEPKKHLLLANRLDLSNFGPYIPAP